MTIDHSDVLDRIEAILVANSTPQFQKVIVGEPLGLPLGGPHAAVWYLGRELDGMTLGNAMIVERYQVMCFWPRRPELATLETFENEIADADQALATAFRADSTLNGESTDLSITDSRVDYGVFPSGNTIYRSLEFELRVLDLEGEAIAP